MTETLVALAVGQNCDSRRSERGHAYRQYEYMPRHFIENHIHIRLRMTFLGPEAHLAACTILQVGPLQP